MTAAADYQRAHRAVVKVKGAARDLSCITCGEPALEWAFQPSESELRTPEGWPYSHNPEDYASMCRACHLKKDRARLREEDPVGFHEKFVGAGKKAGASSAARFRNDPEHAAQARAVRSVGGLRSSSIHRTCSCGLTSSPGGIGRHQSISGHTGYTEGTP